MCNVPCFLCGDYDECKIISKEKIKANKLNNEVHKVRSIFNLEHQPVPDSVKAECYQVVKILRSLITK